MDERVLDREQLRAAIASLTAGERSALVAVSPIDGPLADPVPVWPTAEDLDGLIDKGLGKKVFDLFLLSRDGEKAMRYVRRHAIRRDTAGKA